MEKNAHPAPPRRALIGRFWTAGRGFWLKETRVTAWVLTTALIAIVLIQLFVQYRLNIWNRDLFNAIEKKDGDAVLVQAFVFMPLALATVGLAVMAVYGRMKMQREWRAFVTDRIMNQWLAHGHYYQLNLLRGEHHVPESRITDDARIATDPPVDFSLGIFNSIITAITFIGVLWAVGGSIAVGAPDAAIVIPGYLVVAAIGYSALMTLGMLLIGHRFVAVSEATSQAEAEFRYALTRLRENGESIALLGGEDEERRGLRQRLGKVIAHWRLYSHQHMRSAVVTNANYLLAPTIPLILCAPKYLDGTMTLGEVTQAAAAFVQVQSSFNWLVDNYPRFADWMASLRRVATLMAALDHLEAVGKPGEVEAIRRTALEGPALRLRDLSVTLDDGTAVINDADVSIEPRERVLVVGESGTGKSTLVRAIAGLWPWGQGEIAIRRGAKLFLMPQRPYIPLGSLRRAATYPLSSDTIPHERLRDLMQHVGLDYLIDRLDQDAAWDHILSGGEKQRLAFVRLLLHQPDIVIMDEATLALDPAAQGKLMLLVADHLADAAIISIAHRPELEAFHHRKLVFQHRPDGSRVISDDIINPPSSAPARPPHWRGQIAGATN